MRSASYAAHTFFPRVYRDAALRLPDKVRNAEAYSPPWGNAAEYAVLRKVGRGRFGDVFRAVHTPTAQACVVKVLKPLGRTVMQRLRREYGVYQALTGGPLVSDLLDILVHPTTQTPALVFPWMENLERRDLFARLDVPLIRFYMFRLLQALDFAHSRGVMHRDVKPGNVLFDPATNGFRLIDWGLSEFYLPGVERNTRISTRPFKAPELQLEVGHYDYGVDVWAAGCTMASLCFGKYPFFYEKGDAEAKTDPLIRHVEVLGTEELERYMHRMGLRFSEAQLQGIKRKKRRVPWASLVTQDNAHRVCDDAFDLLDKLLRFDHTERITAAEAMQHAFFAPIRGGDRA